MKVFAHSPHPRYRWLSKPVNSGAFRRWLIDQGSLTKRLQACSKDFRVRPMRLVFARPQQDEAAVLGIAGRQQVLLREVQLYCRDRPVVFAHSLLPRRALRGQWIGLGRLGARPLGGALFADPRVKRTALEYRKLSRHHALYWRVAAHMPQAPAMFWGRRSVFSLGCAAILVTEVFLPDVLQL